MLKNNKGKTLLTSFLILCPIIAGLALWNRLPDTMAIHWGPGGEADSFAPRWAAVLLFPLFLLAVHLLALFVTGRDKKQEGQSKKALELIFWLVPCLSIFISCFFYAWSLGKKPAVGPFMSLLIGLLFVIVGNYMPKMKPNRTLGIRIPWTLNNEENWVRTHRLGGKIFVISGVLILLCSLLPSPVNAAVMLALAILACLIITLYSFCLSRKLKK